MINKKGAFTRCCIAAALCASAVANADIVGGGYTPATASLSGSTFVNVPLNGEGSGASYVIQFATTAANQGVSVMMESVCWFLGGGNTNGGDFVDLELRIDGNLVMSPSQKTEPFCTKIVSPLYNAQIKGMSQFFAQVPSAGTHQLTVKARMANWGVPGTSSAWGSVGPTHVLINK